MKMTQLFTPDECDEIYEFTKSLRFTDPAECERAWLRNGELQWVRERYETIDLGDRFRTLGFNRFQTGTSMRSHQDLMAPNLMVNITFINEDYEGGLLIVDGGIVPLSKGMTVTYPGSLWHEVTEVTSGVRLTMGQLIADHEDGYMIRY